MHFAKTTGQKWLQIALDWHAVGLRCLFSKSWSVEIVGHFLESMVWLSFLCGQNTNSGVQVEHPSVCSQVWD